MSIERNSESVSTSQVTSRNGDDLSNNYAAVDLGSNSFHLVISEYRHGEFNVMDRQREVVRLAGGLDKDGLLNHETEERAHQCLSKFGQLLRGMPKENVRVVGTNALRRMHNKGEFLEKAEQSLGHNIEIIAGREEARLIYLGVSKWSAMTDQSRLVIDIGGGSTEIIVGKGDISHCRESFEVGCVVQSVNFFHDGKLSRKRFKKAVTAAKLAIQPVVTQFRMYGWNEVLGCSGTMKAIAQVLREEGFCKDGITVDGLQRLLDYVVSFKRVDRLQVKGLSRDRTPVIAGGLSVLLALFELFEIQEMSVSDIALREGVLYDLVGRSSAEDIRDTTVSAMLAKWSINVEHADKVSATVMHLYQQVANDWDIQDRLLQKALSWSAQLHELGLLVSHDGYHHHGAYIVQNADMAGFARRDQLLLAALIMGHRRKFPLETFEQLPSVLVTPAKRIAVLLRLAVLMHRERGTQSVLLPSLKAKGQQLTLTFEENSLDSYPLTRADLQQEKIWLENIGISLEV